MEMLIFLGIGFIGIGLFGFVSAFIMPWLNRGSVNALYIEIEQLRAIIKELLQCLKKKALLSLIYFN